MRRHVLCFFPCSSFCILKCLSTNVNCVFLGITPDDVLAHLVAQDFWRRVLRVRWLLVAFFAVFHFFYFCLFQHFFFFNFLLFSSNLICVFLDAWRPSNWRWLFIRLPTGQGFKRMRSKRIKKMLSATLKLKTRWEKKNCVSQVFFVHPLCGGRRKRASDPFFSFWFFLILRPIWKLDGELNTKKKKKSMK